MEPDRSCRILVVDDEPTVRLVVAAMLRQAGYKNLLQAEDGCAALEVLDRVGHDVALVITDIRMPRMSGAELAEQLRHGWPHIKVLCNWRPVKGF